MIDRAMTSEATVNLNAYIKELHKNFGTALTPNKNIRPGYNFHLQAAT